LEGSLLLFYLPGISTMFISKQPLIFSSSAFSAPFVLLNPFLFRRTAHRTQACMAKAEPLGRGRSRPRDRGETVARGEGRQHRGAETRGDRSHRTLQTVHRGSLIQDLPLGIDTDLGKMKDALSGGLMQRLGLARCLYLKHNFLVMDEATSALDAESESEIQKTLEELRGRVTVVIIAHRLNTIQHADKVILLEDGQVQDSGTFKELLARNLSVERAVDLMRIDEDD
jgi:hypothetical protein